MMSCREGGAIPMPRLERWEKQFVVVLAVLAVVMLGFIVYSRHFWLEATRPKSKPADLAKVAALTDLRFPSGARLKSSRYIKYFPMSFLWAEVVIPSQEVEAFKKTAGERVKITWTPDYRMSNITTKWMEKEGVKPPAWWHPELVREGVGGSRQIGADDYTEVMIGQPDRGMVLVYVQRSAG